MVGLARDPDPTQLSAAAHGDNPDGRTEEDTMRTVAILTALLIGTPCTNIAAAQAVSVENTSSFVGNGRWDWTVYLRADKALLGEIKCVEYTLHPTFPNPLQVICERGNEETPFALDGSGWGEFNVQITVKFTNRPPLQLTHWLKLSSPNRPQICSVAATKILGEHGVWSFGPPLYVYVEEIHKTRASHLIMISTTQKLDLRTFDWHDVKRGLKEAKTNTLLGNTYRELDLKPEQPVTLMLPGKSNVQLFANYPSQHGTIEVDICK